VCNIALQPDVVILLVIARGITMTGYAALLHTSFFCNIDNSLSEASTPTCRGDAFGTKLIKSYMFGSSGLNLAFEGLVLG
jgi:hypothetical protein